MRTKRLLQSEMERIANSPEVWKIFATGLTSVVLTLLVAWLSVGREIVTTDEVRRMILTEAPYMADRQLLQQGVSKNGAAILDINEDLRDIQLAQVEAATKLDLIIAQLDQN